MGSEIKLNYVFTSPPTSKAILISSSPNMRASLLILATVGIAALWGGSVEAKPAGKSSRNDSKLRERGMRNLKSGSGKGGGKGGGTGAGKDPNRAGFGGCTCSNGMRDFSTTYSGSRDVTITARNQKNEAQWFQIAVNGQIRSSPFSPRITNGDTITVIIPNKTTYTDVFIDGFLIGAIDGDSVGRGWGVHTSCSQQIVGVSYKVQGPDHNPFDDSRLQVLSFTDGNNQFCSSDMASIASLPPPQFSPGGGGGGSGYPYRSGNSDNGPTYSGGFRPQPVVGGDEYGETEYKAAVEEADSNPVPNVVFAGGAPPSFMDEREQVVLTNAPTNAPTNVPTNAPTNAPTADSKSNSIQDTDRKNAEEGCEFSSNEMKEDGTFVINKGIDPCSKINEEDLIKSSVPTSFPEMVTTGGSDRGGLVGSFTFGGGRRTKDDAGETFENSNYLRRNLRG